MEPSQLLGYLEDNGYTYDEAEKAFRKDGGVFGNATGEDSASQGAATENPASVFDAMAYQADGREMVFSAYVQRRESVLHAIVLGCSSIDYLAEAYRVDATLEGLADGALWLAPYYTSPEVAAMLKSQGR